MSTKSRQRSSFGNKRADLWEVAPGLYRTNHDPRRVKVSKSDLDVVREYSVSQATGFRKALNYLLRSSGMKVHA